MKHYVKGLKDTTAITKGKLYIVYGWSTQEGLFIADDNQDEVNIESLQSDDLVTVLLPELSFTDQTSDHMQRNGLSASDKDNLLAIVGRRSDTLTNVEYEFIYKLVRDKGITIFIGDNVNEQFITGYHVRHGRVYISSHLLVVKDNKAQREYYYKESGVKTYL